MPTTVELLPESAAWHPPSHTLIVADVHLGKSASFRAHGVPVPEGDDSSDLARLAHLAAKHQAAHLVIAGDLFHAPSGITPELLCLIDQFLHQIQIPLTLTLGNHDTKIRTLPPGIKIRSHIDLPHHGPRIIHDPADATPGHFHIAGHIHPVIRIRDGHRTSLRLPCFWQQKNLLILPSFGTFTGGSIIKPANTDTIFAQLRHQVVEIPPALWR